LTGSNKVICPKCQAKFLHGTDVCWECGQVIDPEAFASRIINGDSPMVVPQGNRKKVLPGAGLPAVILHTAVLILVRHNKKVYPEDTAPQFTIPEKQGPIVVGRADYTNKPPIVPPIDLTSLFTVHLVDVEQPCVSRVQAALYHTDTGFRIRAGFGASTWVRRSGSPNFVRIRDGEECELNSRDIITFGHPGRDHVRLRIVF